MCNALAYHVGRSNSSTEDFTVVTKEKIRCDLQKKHDGPHKGWLKYYSAPGVTKQVRYSWN